MPQGALGSPRQKLGFGIKAWQFAVLSLVDMLQVPLPGHMLLGPEIFSRVTTKVSSRFGSAENSASAAA
jgi:hypothetical protein